MADKQQPGRPGIDQQVTFLSCADLDPMTAFYGDLLGLPLVLDQGACRIYQTGRDAFLGFCRRTDNMPAERPAGVILTLVVDRPAAVDDWHAYLLAAGMGAIIDKPPAINRAFNIYHLFLRDPDENLVEIQTFLDHAWPRRNLIGGEND